MKSLRLTGTFVLLLFIAACTKDGINPLSSSLKSSGGSALPAGISCDTIINVAAPNGVDDDQKLLDAFTAAKLAGPGSVVQLAEGTYRIGFIEIREFFGSFVGTGQRKTIIKFKSGLDCSSTYPKDPTDYAVFLKFIGGDIYMADMTLETPVERVCLAGTGGGFGGAAGAQVVFASRSGKWDPEDLYIKAWINNVEFKGIHATYNPPFYNTYGAIWAYQCGDKMEDGAFKSIERSQEDIKITNCTFDTFFAAVSIGFLKESTIILGEKNKGNLINDCRIGIDLEDFINIDVSMYDNLLNLEGQFGTYFDNIDLGYTIEEPQTRRSKFDIQGNIFNLKKIVVYYNNSPTYTNGIIIKDIRRFKGENMPLAVLIKSNDFKFSEEGYLGIHLRATVDPVIRNNRFTGDGFSGIAGCFHIIQNQIFDTRNGLILGNNFSGARFSNASIILQPNSYNWSVVGGGSSNETILNMGTNNLITGVNIKDSEVPLGETIKDNMDMINDLFRGIHKRDLPF